MLINKSLVPFMKHHTKLSAIRVTKTNAKPHMRPVSFTFLLGALEPTGLWCFMSIPQNKLFFGTKGRWLQQQTLALSFYVTKTVLVGPKWFWSDQIDLDLTIMIWSQPKWNGHDQNELVRSKLWFSTKMNHIWTWPIHFGHDHLILVVNISLWSSPNQFGKTKTILDRPNLFWSHRRTRH